MLDHVSGISSKRDLDGDEWIVSECSLGAKLTRYSAPSVCVAVANCTYLALGLQTSRIFARIICDAIAIIRSGLHQMQTGQWSVDQRSTVNRVNH